MSETEGKFGGCFPKDILMQPLIGAKPPMTETLDMEELKRLHARAAKGPWQLQDGCSWRRIGGWTDRGFEDGNVLRPYNSRSDGHPDISADQSTLELIVAMRNSLPALIAEVERLRAAIQAFIDGEFDRPVSTPYRNDGISSKSDKCKHDNWMYEDCEGCASEWFQKVLAND